MPNLIKENIKSLKEEIDKEIYINNIKRNITLVAVSKTFPSDDIITAFESGHLIYGESKVQESEEKIPIVNNYAEKKGKKIEWHLIGHLQSNKAKTAVQIFDAIHSLDKKSTIKEVSKRAKAIDKTINIFIQVNTTGEESKYGCPKEKALDLSKYAIEQDNINLVGYMTIAPFVKEEKPISTAFSTLRILRDDISVKLNRDIPYLSMGMTNDWKIALKEGATHLRIGSRIFGKRDYA